MSFSPPHWLHTASDEQRHDLPSLSDAGGTPAGYPPQPASPAPAPASRHPGAPTPLSLAGDDDVAELVDRLAGVVRKLNELAERTTCLKAKKAALEAEIVAHAQHRRTNVLLGFTARVGLKTDVVVQLPTKDRDPAGYDQLDHTLRSSRDWPAVSRFGRHALQRIWTGRQRDPGDVRRLIAPYVAEQVQTRVKMLSTALD